MFEVGFTELLLIFALSLLVLGPQKLPKLAQQVGRWVGRARAMARQFRDQLEEEAHSLETKVSIDPDIDTSLDPKKPATPAAPAAPAPPASTGDPAADAPPPAPPMYAETDEDFYPPDHHMHPGNRAAAETPAGAPEQPAPGAEPPSSPSAQGELDLTTPRDEPPKS
jgi:sec-independent protein translocase protein TatB